MVGARLGKVGAENKKKSLGHGYWLGQRIKNLVGTRLDHGLDKG